MSQEEFICKLRACHFAVLVNTGIAINRYQLVFHMLTNKLY
jgi:hypothetical protein